MTATDTAALLDDAADWIADISRADLRMEDDVEDALRDLAGEFGMTRNDTIRFIVTGVLVPRCPLSPDL